MVQNLLWVISANMKSISKAGHKRTICIYYVSLDLMLRSMPHCFNAYIHVSSVLTYLFPYSISQDTKHDDDVFAFSFAQLQRAICQIFGILLLLLLLYDDLSCSIMLTVFYNLLGNMYVPLHQYAPTFAVLISCSFSLGFSSVV